MSSINHDSKLEEIMRDFDEDGTKIIRLHKRGNPDAILINWKSKEVFALEMETKRVSWSILNIKGDLEDFDEVIYFIPDFKKNLIDEYEIAKKLFSLGKSLYFIHKKTGVSLGQIHAWLKQNKKPYQISFMKKIKKKHKNVSVVFY